MTLTVAAIVNKARPVLDRFVRWYRAQGAARIGPCIGNPAEQRGTATPGPCFRRQLPRDQVLNVCGGDSARFRRRFGLVGHADGKAFHRAGQTGSRRRGGALDLPADVAGWLA